ncbi:MAG: nucleotide exchange factor GrpE [Bacteroidales bacterium]|jgi:molecular chaperone GrpE|nr:nucleotide exchange factor GrpE [Bacteroidales bacterium]MCK9499095.1 nucleotide exchange factor GrpE [Bacteroidales bacterium]MDY0314340.1 nucleotide exchange factor GrpE [Bacteroidales bacterium]NLB86900.1 nucleotide exchange factor GrpE [Bacteroidales bacterium]
MDEILDNSQDLEQNNLSDINHENSEDIKKSNESEQVKDKKADKSSVKKKERKLKEEISYLEEQNNELKDKYLRIVAEYENFRKRTAKEKLDLREEVKAKLMLDFIQVVDDMDRAVEHLDDVKDLEATVEGVKLINQKFLDFLKTQGIEEIIAQDLDFDLDLHEAVTRFPVEEEDKKGKVVNVIQKGYKLNDKVIRYSKVVVGE